MQNWLLSLLTCSLTMSVLGLSYLALAPLLSRRYAASTRYYAWLIIVLGFIVPLRPHIGQPIVIIQIPDAILTPAPLQHSDLPTSDTLPDAPNVPISLDTPAASKETSPASAMEPHYRTSFLTVWQITFLPWLLGAIIFVGYQALKHYRFAKAVTRWSERETSVHTLALFAELLAEMNLQTNFTGSIGLYRCPCIGSPMLLGLHKPCILLPTANFSQDELRFVLKHELTHFRRYDLWYKAAVHIAVALHWFNPVVYLLAKAIDAACELSCDASVLSNTDIITRQQYSETIIGVIRHRTHLQTALSTNFYGGKREMKNRIYAIMDIGKKKIGIALLSVVLILTVSTGMVFAAAETLPRAKVEIQTTTGTIFTVIDGTNSAVSSISVSPWYFTEGSTTDATLEVVAPEWYTYEEYKAWLEEQKIILQDNIGSTGWGESTGEITFTQSLVDEIIAGYEKTLKDIENGLRVSKPYPTSMMMKQGAEFKYSTYAPYGLSTEQSDGKLELYFEGQRVRYFEDFYSLGENMSAGINFFDPDGTVDLHGIRDFTQIMYNDDGSYDPGGIFIGVKAYSQEEFDRRTQQIEEAQREWNNLWQDRDNTVHVNDGSLGSVSYSTITTITENASSAATASAASYDASFIDTSLKSYLDHGISYDLARNAWIYNRKPIAFLLDPEHQTYMNFSYDNHAADFEAQIAASGSEFLKIARRTDGTIETIRELTSAEAAQEIRSIFDR